MSGVGAVLLIIVTLFIPPVGVFLMAGCGADLFINICLTLLGYIPGHVHAYYLMFVRYERKSGRVPMAEPAPGIYSERVNYPGGANYGTL